MLFRRSIVMRSRIGKTRERFANRQRGSIRFFPASDERSGSQLASLCPRWCLGIQPRFVRPGSEPQELTDRRGECGVGGLKSRLDRRERSMPSV